MSFGKLQEFIELAKKAGVTKLEYEKGEEKFAVSFAGEPVVGSAISHHAPAASPIAASAAAPKPASNLKEITSPFVGTFYRSASPDSDSYVQVGHSIEPGKVLCIVEAMKIMNEIESDISGEIVEICAENETYVEFGQVLFRVKPGKA
tara:strand:+ start:4601 stop:5044 length:444 start_codon:yes stop_codon:yes gene_type:complete